MKSIFDYLDKEIQQLHCVARIESGRSIAEMAADHADEPRPSG